MHYVTIVKLMNKQKTKTKKMKICPFCGKGYTRYPALSRRDNATEICPECGIKEALADISRRIDGTWKDIN